GVHRRPRDVRNRPDRRLRGRQAAGRVRPGLLPGRAARCAVRPADQSGAPADRRGIRLGRLEPCARARARARDQLTCAVPAPAGSLASAGCRGMKTPMTRPISVNTSIMVRAAAKGLPVGSFTATMTEPTSAVPKDDPRLETLRDRPEI